MGAQTINQGGFSMTIAVESGFPGHVVVGINTPTGVTQWSGFGPEETHVLGNLFGFEGFGRVDTSTTPTGKFAPSGEDSTNSQETNVGPFTPGLNPSNWASPVSEGKSVTSYTFSITPQQAQYAADAIKNYSDSQVYSVVFGTVCSGFVQNIMNAVGQSDIFSEIPSVFNTQLHQLSNNGNLFASSLDPFASTLDLKPQSPIEEDENGPGTGYNTVTEGGPGSGVNPALTQEGHSYGQGSNQPSISSLPAGSAAAPTVDSQPSTGTDGGGASDSAAGGNGTSSPARGNDVGQSGGTDALSGGGTVDQGARSLTVHGPGNVDNSQGATNGVSGSDSQDGTSGSGTSDGSNGGGTPPLVLNLSGGAVHTTDLATSAVTFDVNGDGRPVKTGWITAGEAFLVEDPNGAAVTSGAQFIANFGQLAACDADGDGQLSAAEADAAGLRLWVDRDGSGTFRTGELETLAQAGVASIAVQAATTGTYDNGNLLSADASFTRADGTRGDIADAFLMNGDVLDDGMVYETAQGLTVRGADGSAVSFLTGTGQSVDMGASGLSAVVDAGSNNTITAGGDAAVVIAGDGDTVKAGTARNALLIGAGTGVSLVGDAGNTAFVALGDANTIVTGAGTSTVAVEGDGATVHAGRGTTTLVVDGDGAAVTLGANGTATLNGAGDTLTGVVAAGTGAAGSYVARIQPTLTGRGVPAGNSRRYSRRMIERLRADSVVAGGFGRPTRPSARCGLHRAGPWRRGGASRSGPGCGWRLTSRRASGG